MESKGFTLLLIKAGSPPTLQQTSLLPCTPSWFPSRSSDVEMGARKTAPSGGAAVALPIRYLAQPRLSDSREFPASTIRTRHSLGTYISPWWWHSQCICAAPVTHLSVWTLGWTGRGRFSQRRVASMAASLVSTCCAAAAPVWERRASQAGLAALFRTFVLFLPLSDNSASRWEAL